MRLSQYRSTTLKETPAEADIVSHHLMLRAGMIRRSRDRPLHVAADGPAHPEKVEAMCVRR